MRLKTLLNRYQKHRSFINGPARLMQGRRLDIEFEIKSPKQHSATCRGPALGSNTLPERRFEFVSLWGISVFLAYAVHRATFARSSVPRATGKHQLTDSYPWSLPS